LLKSLKRDHQVVACSDNCIYYFIGIDSFMSVVMPELVPEVVDLFKRDYLSKLQSKYQLHTMVMVDNSLNLKKLEN
jgi:hypothetical protein